MNDNERLDCTESDNDAPNRKESHHQRASVDRMGWADESGIHATVDGNAGDASANHFHLEGC
jgi:hypothetical protein